MTELERVLLQAYANGTKYIRVGDTTFYVPKPVKPETQTPKEAQQKAGSITIRISFEQGEQERG